MHFISGFADYFVNLDKHLDLIIQSFRVWTYLLLFLIIFCETGFVVTPFLPGDSLLFAAGVMSAREQLGVGWLILVLSLAAILGDTVNYWIGFFVGPKIFTKEKSRFVKKEYLERTHKFYEKYGKETIIIARFVPIIRTFAPFLAGIGYMTYWRFISYNVIGGIAWVGIFVLAGYFFSDIPLVQNNFSLVILAIIFVSVLPGIIGFLREIAVKGKR